MIRRHNNSLTVGLYYNRVLLVLHYLIIWCLWCGLLTSKLDTFLNIMKTVDPDFARTSFVDLSWPDLDTSRIVWCTVCSKWLCLHGLARFLYSACMFWMNYTAPRWTTSTVGLYGQNIRLRIQPFSVQYASRLMRVFVIAFGSFTGRDIS